TDHGAPESTMPTGAQFLISAREAVQGSTTEKTFCSRMRRAMSCEYCAPKSRTTMDWVSTDEFLRLMPELQTKTKPKPQRTQRHTGGTATRLCSCVPCGYRNLSHH